MSDPIDEIVAELVSDDLIRDGFMLPAYDVAKLIRRAVAAGRELGRSEGAESRQAAIVAWLRKADIPRDLVFQQDGLMDPEYLADAIEAGEHLKERK